LLRNKTPLRINGIVIIGIAFIGILESNVEVGGLK
jgi:hypothetical protein